MSKLRKNISSCIILALLLLLPPWVFPQEPVTRAEYLAYAAAAADKTWESYDERIERWKQTFDPNNVFGYRPPGGLLEMAVIYAYLYSQEKNPVHLHRAKKILLTYDDFRAMYPQWAVENRPDYDEAPPVLPDFFTVMRYIRAYILLKDHTDLSPSEENEIETIIAESMDYLLRSAEWGTMNRTVLRAESLAWAVRALPHHPETKKWETQRRALGDDNWGNWEIEDASNYNAVWLYSLCGYAHCQGNMDELFKTPEMYYYAQYFLNLMSPAGMIPDFGDSRWLDNWYRFLVYFETAAAQYQSSQLKWAAATIARNQIDFSNPDNIGLGYILLDCYLWGSDKMTPKPPDNLSGEVMEDVQGKKIVFRSGWDVNASYMLLNYRDEGDGGLNFRDYLRDTIPVEEEKMTHGHADENSIVMLMSAGSLLLHDGGYRDYMPSGPFGAYRQDYFHNRLCVRQEKIFMGQQQGQFRYSIRDAIPGQNILDFLRNAGSYRLVRTQKVDFITLPDFDYSRTRLIDTNLGYEWDRVITSIKNPEIYVIFDIFKSYREDYYTLANLWHTRKIIEQGNHWYDTVYDRIQKHTFPENKHLLILFPLTHYRLESVDLAQRHYQEEIAISQYTAQHFERAETTGFITLLIPHAPDDAAQNWVKRISLLPVDKPEAGLGVAIQTDKQKILVGVKQDLRMDMIRDWRRPRYTYAAGKIAFGDFETNGDFIYAAQENTLLNYTIVNLTKAKFKDQILIEAKPSLFGLAFDASPYQGGQGKMRYWRDSLELK